MPSYKVKVKNGAKISTVAIDATTEHAARAEANRHGKVLEVKRGFQITQKAKLGRGDRAMLFQRLAAMLASKVGTGEALRLLQETFRGRISAIAGEMRHKIEAGESLVGAMEAIGPRAFPESTLAIIRTGSQGGNQAKALRDAIRFEQESEQIKKESGKGIWQAVGGFVAGVITLLGTTMYVVPEMEDSPMLKAMDVSGMPGWVEVTSQVLTVIAIVVTFMLVVTGILTKVLRPIMPGHVDDVVSRLPVIKDVVLARKNYLSFYGFGILMRAGLRTEEALRLSAESAERGKVRKDFEAAHDAVRNGRPWAPKMSSLHPTDQAALSTSQDRLQQAEAIEAIAVQYRDIYRLRIEQIIPFAMLGAALFLTASGAVLFGAVILPLLEMTQSAMTSM